MDRSIRYEVLQGEEAQVPAEPVQLALVVPPPTYQEATVGEDQGAISTAATTGLTYPVYNTNLPSYKVATELPSYEEAERSKEQESREQGERTGDVERQDSDVITGMTVGTDGLFLCTFVISFLFNWIGFLVSLCISNTVAGRCGAISGLGLSIVKWAAIVKHNNWMNHYVAAGDTWVCWALIVCGFAFFFRGCVQYIRVKYEWQRLTGQLRRYYLLN
ncbi:NEDD4 family-interacting protein 1-like [Liolophura sinensis]|uniref:NEDD4 family-interacting protein 1-like n=1 Tax=Liolophura sinensis TaxID=3198878 RepID=UPI0031581470